MLYGAFLFAVRALPTLPSDALTIAAWVRLLPPLASASSTGPARYALVTLGTSASPALAITAHMTYRGGMGAAVMSVNGSQSCAGSDDALSDGAWHHVAFTYTATNSKFTYVSESTA
jgi:hypothetical protein